MDKNLNEVQKKLEIVVEKRDSSLLEDISRRGDKSPRGLIHRGTYEIAPEWIQIILTTGASYYYNSTSNFSRLWREDAPDLGFRFAESLLKERLPDSIENLRKLKTLIDNVLPSVILNAPASIKEENFLD
jgi:hypothetical protein